MPISSLTDAYRLLILYASTAENNLSFVIKLTRTIYIVFNFIEGITLGICIRSGIILSLRIFFRYSLNLAL